MVEIGYVGVGGEFTQENWPQHLISRVPAKYLADLNRLDLQQRNLWPTHLPRGFHSDRLSD